MTLSFQQLWAKSSSSPVWLARCLSRCCFCLKALSHAWQENGLISAHHHHIFTMNECNPGIRLSLSASSQQPINRYTGVRLCTRCIYITYGYHVKQEKYENKWYRRTSSFLESHWTRGTTDKRTNQERPSHYFFCVLTLYISNITEPKDFAVVYIYIICCCFLAKTEKVHTHPQKMFIKK